MIKIFAVILVVLIGKNGSVWGGAEYPMGSFVEIAESTRNLFAGYIRCGSLIKSLVLSPETPMLIAIKEIGVYSIEINAKIKQVYEFLASLVDKTADNFLDECSIANPTLKLSSQRSTEIWTALLKDLENWLANHKIFLPE